MKRISVSDLRTVNNFVVEVETPQDFQNYLLFRSVMDCECLIIDISAEKLKNLFETFYKKGSTTKKKTYEYALLSIERLDFHSFFNHLSSLLYSKYKNPQWSEDKAKDMAIAKTGEFIVLLF
jgi:hypothetical protein